jgi:O-antigen/teichoic acid export membrane protein
MVAFGGHLTGFNVVNYLNRNVDGLLVGRLFGAYQLGLYSKAYQLLLLPLHQINGPMTRVAVPALSRLQHDPERYRTYYHHAILLLCAASMPAVVLLFVTADQAIPLILGRQWVDAVFLFQLLAPAAFIGTFNVATGWVYVSLGQTNRQLRMGSAVAVVTLAAFVIGTRWGVAGVAAACSAAACLTRYPTILYCFRTTPLRAGDLFRAVWQPAVASVLAGAAVYGMRTLWPMPSVHLSLAFAACVAAYGAAYVLIWQAFPQGREALGILTRAIRRPIVARRAKYEPVLTPSAY